LLLHTCAASGYFSMKYEMIFDFSYMQARCRGNLPLGSVAFLGIVDNIQPKIAWNIGKYSGIPGLFLAGSIIINGLICTICLIMFEGITGSCFNAQCIGWLLSSSVLFMASSPKMSSN